MQWGMSPWLATFSPDGSYRACWGDCLYIGSWSWIKGVLHITESCTPEVADSWRHYEIAFDLRTMRGRTQGECIVPVRLERAGRERED